MQPSELVSLEYNKKNGCLYCSCSYTLNPTCDHSQFINYETVITSAFHFIVLVVL